MSQGTEDEESLLAQSIRDEQALVKNTAPRVEIDIDFSTWADVSALLMKRTRKEQGKILENRGIEAVKWDICNKHWNEILVDDIVEGRRERPKQYGERCADEMENRVAEQKKQEAQPGLIREKPSQVEPPPAPLPIPAPIPASNVPPIPAPMAQPPAAVAQGDTAWSRVGTETRASVHGRTQDIEAAMAALGPSGILPFRGKSTSEPRPKGPSKEIEKPSKPEVQRPNSGTVDVEAAMAAGISLKPLPFAKVAPTPPSPASPASPPIAPNAPLGTSADRGGLTLEQYASLCAETNVFPAKIAQIAGRYNIPDEAALRALHDAWQTWLARDFPTWQRWRELEKQYRQWLETQIPR